MKKGYIYIILAAIIFSTMEIAGKMLSNQINPLQLNLLRFFIGAVILLPFALKYIKKMKIKFNQKDLEYFIITGLLCVVISMSFFQLAIVYTKASMVAIIFSTNPVFTVPFAYLILKEKISKSTIISLFVSLLGIICILNPFNMSRDIKGITLSILAALTFSLYSVIGKTKSSRYGSTVLNCVTFFAGDIIMLIIILISNIPKVAEINKYLGLSLFSNIPILYGVSTSNIIILLYMGIVVTGLGYLFYFFAMDETSATTASIVFFIKPALAPILSLIILKETIAFNVILGIVFILIGSYITLRGKNKQIEKQKAA